MIQTSYPRTLNIIHQLYFYHLVNEAIEAQKRFNDCWERYDMEALKDLLDDGEGSSEFVTS